MSKLNYSKTLENGKNRVYEIELDGENVTLTYGIEGGKLSTTNKTLEAKYVGKINEMSAETKACELVSKKHDELVEKDYELVDGDIDTILETLDAHAEAIADAKTARDEAKAEAKAKREADKAEAKALKEAEKVDAEDVDEAEAV